MLPRLPISPRRSSSDFAPAPMPITTIRPPVASAATLPGRLGAPTSSRMTSNGPCSSKPSGSIALTSSASMRSRLVGVADGGGDARAGHLAELDARPCRRRRRAPWTSRRSPARSPAWVKSASWAVVKTSGTPPAASHSSSSGTGIAVRSWTTASSAWPPPATIDITRSPGSKRWTPGPHRDDLARQLEAGDVLRRAGRRGVAALELHHVGAVEPGAADADEQVGVAGDRIGVLLDGDRPVANRGGAHRRDATSGVARAVRTSSRA